MALQDMILFDVAVATIVDKATGQKFLSKDLTTSGITQSTNETEIRGGRGSALLALVESEKSIEVNLGSATVSKKWLEMQQGAEFEDKKIKMVVDEKVTVTVDPTDSTTLMGTITGTPLTTEVEVTITNCKGESERAVLTGSNFIIPVGFEAKEGDTITALYKAEVDGEVLEFSVDKFPKGWELQLEVPAMDKCSQAITSKVVFYFDNVRPSSSFDMSFAMGEAIAPEMTVKVMKSCCGDSLGRMAIVPITP